MKRFSILIVVLMTAACGTTSYKPVQEIEFERFAKEGCQRSGDRFAVTAHINSAYRETIVLWNGRDSEQTVAVTLPPESVASKARGIFGSSRYELSVDRLQDLRGRRTPVTVNLRCEGSERTPTADRFSYYENGQRVEFEF